MNSTHILAVDDDANQLAALTRVLRRSHFRVTTATNPRIGLRLAITERPDLILLDISMPTMSGHEFLHRLRRWESRRRTNTAGVDALCDIPVIFLTGLAASNQRVSGLDAGAEDYITKPFDPDELRARIRSQLRRVRQQRERLASEEAELLRLKAAMQRTRETARECGAPLLDLDTSLELAELVRRPELRKDLLGRAKKDVGCLTQSLLRIAESPQPKGARP